jgi:hypothetical protein
MDEVEMWKKQIAKEREDIRKYGFGGDGGINYPDDGTDYPKKEEIDAPKWFCKHCMTFTDHNNVKVDIKGEDFTILIGDCNECKNINRNYFPKLKANPIFGIGKIDI